MIDVKLLKSKQKKEEIMEDIRLKAGYKLSRLELVRRILFRSMLRGEHLHHRQMPILVYIVQHEGCTQAEIAEALSVTPSSIATSTKRLQNAGLITKRVDETNLRCNCISATEKGKQVEERARTKHRDLVCKLFEGFNEEEIESLTLMLDRMIANISDENTETLRFHQLVEMNDRLDVEDNEE